MPSASNASISVGYAGNYGGKQSLNGVYDGSETVEHQMRLTYMQMFAPTQQFSREMEPADLFDAVMQRPVALQRSGRNRIDVGPSVRWTE